MNDKYEILNQGYIQLIAHMGHDVSIVRAARVSYNSDSDSDSKSSDDVRNSQLIRYLLKNQHWSPFESVVFKFEVKCPLFIASQWMRHRAWSFSQVSARYTETPEEFFIPDEYRIGLQSSSNHQSRTFEPNKNTDKIIEQIIYSSKCSFNAYQELLKLDCPRELARTVIPEGAYTRFVGTVNLRNLLAFLELRDAVNAQVEIQDYAAAIKKLIQPIVPITMSIVNSLKDVP